MGASVTGTDDISTNVPRAVADYLVAIALQDHAPAYLQVTAEGHLVRSGGSLQKYGLQSVEAGEYVGETFYYLEGFFPLAQTEIMRHLQLEQGPIVDIHIIATGTVAESPDPEGAGWILILDTSAEAERVQRLQQKGNDLSLLRQQYAKLLEQSLTPAQTENSVAEQVEVTEQTVSVLIVKFCGPQFDQLGVDRPAVLKAINASLSFITQVIVEESGLINHILGGTAAAFFGLLPTQQSAPRQAVYAAKRILKRLVTETPSYARYPLPTSELNVVGQTQIGIGASITTGEAAAGILHSQGCHRLNAVGDPIQNAAHMGDYIQPGTITIDSATFEALLQYQHEFQPLDQTVKQSLEQASQELPFVDKTATTGRRSASHLNLYRLNFEQLKQA